MSSIRIAAAQSASVAGDVAANVATHCRFINAAAASGVDLLLFPELSLCGYELQLLGACTLKPSDAVLLPILELAARTQMTVIVGAPVASHSARPHIGAITFLPDGTTSVYWKQYLHAGEEVFAAPGEIGALRHPLGTESYSLAICADTAHAHHASAAAASGASLYLASVLVSEAGYALDAANLQRYAARHKFGVLMANHGGSSGAYLSAGRSAFWSPSGDLVVAAPGVGNCLVIVTGSGGGWRGEAVIVDA
jgi:predicted amidohydrolase